MSVLPHSYRSFPQAFVSTNRLRAARARGVYRPDIDGLRAVAVIAVVATHASITGFSGGFVGVDVFFVISGFLISRNLAKSERLSARDLLAFYGRRMRRTLPALYLVAGVTLASGTLLLMPGPLDDLARSVIAAVAFIPNMLFWTQAGYFDHAAIAKPFLHSWSLGVEEQFYVVAPLLPVTIRRLRPRMRRAALLALFLLTFAFCVGLRALAPAAAFYLMPARLWEFLAGCLVAEGVIPPVRARWLREALGAAAILSLAIAIGQYSDTTAHPGLPTLLPCVATVVLIQLNGSSASLASRLLGSRPVAGIGLISYSIYLWHWPLLVCAHEAGLRLSPAWLMAGLITLLGLSALSWRFVERPFRARGAFCQRKAPAILLAGAALLGATSLVMVFARGLPGRFRPEVAAIASFYDYRESKPYREGQCFITSRQSLGDFNRAICLRRDPDRRNVLLLGDSQAADLWTGLRDRWQATNFLQATASGCRPLLGATGASRCTLMMHEMLHDYLPNHRLDGVILSALWEPDDLAPLTATIAYLKPLVGKVTVFGPVPRYDEPLATLLAKSLQHDDLSTVRRHELPGVSELDSQMRELVTPVASYVSTYEAMCPAGRCRLFAAQGVPMQFDYHHLTKEGAELVMRRIQPDSP